MTSKHKANLINRINQIDAKIESIKHETKSEVQKLKADKKALLAEYDDYCYKAYRHVAQALGDFLVHQEKKQTSLRGLMESMKGISYTLSDGREGRFLDDFIYFLNNDEEYKKDERLRNEYLGFLDIQPNNDAENDPEGS